MNISNRSDKVNISASKKVNTNNDALTIDADTSLESFVKQYESAVQTRQQKRQKQREAAKRKHNQEPDEPTKKYIERAKENKKIEKERLEYGYIWHGNELIGSSISKKKTKGDRKQKDQDLGFRQHAFVYEGLKSQEDDLLKLLLTKLPKNNQASYNKSTLQNIDSKLLSRDLPYIQCNKDLVGVIRVDVDRVFASIDEVKFELSELLFPEAFPQLSVSFRDDDEGLIRNPHLIWILPHNSGVWTGEGAHLKPQNLLQKVRRALVSALVNMGADVGGLANPLRVKNPLSPHSDTHIINQTTLLTLEEIADWIPDENLKVTENALFSDAVELAGASVDLSKEESNILFSKLSKLAINTMNNIWLQNPNIDLSDREKLAKTLEDALAKPAHTLHDNTRQAHAILQKCCLWTAKNFEPAKIQSQRQNAGIMKHTFRGNETLYQRQAAGGRYTNQTVRERNIKIVSDAISRLGGIEKATKAEVVKATGLSRKTVHRLWKEAEKASYGVPKWMT